MGNARSTGARNEHLRVEVSLLQLNLPVGQVVRGALWRGQVVRAGCCVAVAFWLTCWTARARSGHSCLAGGDGLAVTTAVGACIAGPTQA